MAGTPNIFFNNHGSSQEQDLMEALIIEAYSIYGQTMFYIPRVIVNEDKLYTADDQSRYEQAIQLPLYIESYDQFQGDGSFMSKFGLEIRNQMTLTTARRTFSEEVTAETGQVRPNEGDLIFFPPNKTVFQIKYVEKAEMFFALGKLYTWQMNVQLFEYSNEQFNTGIPEIDRLQEEMSTNILDYAILTESGDYLLTENNQILATEPYDLEDIVNMGGNDDFQAEADTFIDWNVNDPFSEGRSVTDRIF